MQADAASVISITADINIGEPIDYAVYAINAFFLLTLNIYNKVMVQV